MEKNSDFMRDEYTAYTKQSVADASGRSDNALQRES